LISWYNEAIKNQERFFMSIPFKKSPIEFNQRQLFPSNIFDLLASDHECYLYKDIFQQLDTSSVESTISRIGQNAYHPRSIVSILIYSYSQGIFQLKANREKMQRGSFLYVYRRNELS
jgi:transposase